MKLFLFILVIIIEQNAFSEEYRLFLTDKGPEKFLAGTNIYSRTLEILSKRCIDRRKKVLEPDKLISIEDAPVYQPYIDSIVRLGGKIHQILRWKNYVVVEIDSNQLNQFKTLPFVKNIILCKSKQFLNSASTSVISDNNSIQNDSTPNYCGNFDYGKSYRQARFLNVPEIHRMGITGEGVLIGVLDNGFRWRQHNSLSNSSILKEYDFVFHDSITYNQQNDVPNQDGHGTLVLSLMAGFSQGNLIGISPRSSYILAKTEDMRFEKHIEEDNYAAGIEWLESEGADICTSSLGYKNFDSTDENYNWEDLDGKSGISASAVNRAVKLGVVCLTAAGNNGPSEKTIITPGDADSVFTIAASDTVFSNVVSFSSRGPVKSGRIKPDFASLGNRVVCASTADSNAYLIGNGTSLATPQMAGGVALLLSVFPELKPYEIKYLLSRNSTLSNEPDNNLGYGIPDILNSMLTAGIIISPVSYFKNGEYLRIIVYSESHEKIKSLVGNIRFANSSEFQKITFYKTIFHSQFIADIPLEKFVGKSAQFFINAETNSMRRRSPYGENQFLIIKPEEMSIACGVNPGEIINNTYSSNLLSIYPTVVEQGKSISINFINRKPTDLEIKVFSLSSELIKYEKIQISSGGFYSHDIVLPDLASAMYFISIQTNEFISYQKFIVIR